MATDYSADTVEYTDENGRRRLSRFTLICDFCCADPSVDPPRWDYEAGVMAIGLGGDIDASDDGWAACDRCHELIEADKWDELGERAIATQITREHVTAVPTVVLDDIRARLQGVWSRFRAARKGPAIPLREEPPDG